MKVTVMRPVEVEVRRVVIVVPVRHGTEDMPADFPGRDGDTWQAIVDVDTGRIADWPSAAGRQEVFMKVCDSGIYTLLDEDGEVVAHVGDYVPSLIPNEYGDYLSFYISEDGMIEGWEPLPEKLREFFDEDVG